MGNLQRLRNTGAIRELQTAFRTLCKVAAQSLWPYKQLVKALKGTGIDAHHIFQNSPMKAALGNAYSKGAGLAIGLIGSKRFGPGSPHGAATGFQNANGAVLGQIEYGALIAAGCSPEDARTIVDAAESWNEAQGWAF